MIVMKRIIALLAGTMMLASCMINFGGTNVMGYTEEGCDFSQERPMAAFDEINVAGAFNVYYIQSDESKVLVEGKEEFVEKVITELNDEALTIKLEPGTYHNLVLKVTVYSPEVDEINVAGSGDFFDVAGHTSRSSIEYRLAGSGDLTLAALSTKDDLEIDLAGSGDVRADGIVCKDLEIRLAGSGDIRIDATVENDIDARINGSGDITLNGSCDKAELKISGSGDMRGNLSYKKISTSCNGSGRISL